MPRSLPPLDTRRDILNAWSTTGTVLEVARRLNGQHERSTINAVRDWANLHGYLLQKPPRGLRLSSAGRRWLDASECGEDPHDRPQPVFRTRVPPPRPPSRMQIGSTPHRTLTWLNRFGADSAKEIAANLGILSKRARNVCRDLRRAGYITHRLEKRTIRMAWGERVADVLVYSITDEGRCALLEAA